MEARRYRFTVEGELSDRMGTAFPGMVLARTAGRTQLVGVVRDQAELQGILSRLCDLGMTLVAAVAIEGDEE